MRIVNFYLPLFFFLAGSVFAQNNCISALAGSGANDVRFSDEVIDSTDSDFIVKLAALGPNSSSKKIVLVDDSCLLDGAILNALENSDVRVFLKREDSISDTLALLDTHVTSVRIISFIPTDSAGISNMYSLDTNEAALAEGQMKSVAKGIQTIPNSQNYSKPIANKAIADYVSDILSQQSQSTLIIAAHNDGALVRFPDNSSLSVVRLNQMLKNHQGRGILLSCKTIDVAHGAAQGVYSNSRLEWDAIVAACKRAVAVTEENHNASFADLIRAIDIGLNDPARTSSKRRKIIVYGLTGGLLVALIIKEDESQKIHA